jgi:hypothetical protein
LSGSLDGTPVPCRLLALTQQLVELGQGELDLIPD